MGRQTELAQKAEGGEADNVAGDVAVEEGAARPKWLIEISSSYLIFFCEKCSLHGNGAEKAWRSGSGLKCHMNHQDDQYRGIHYKVLPLHTI